MRYISIRYYFLRSKILSIFFFLSLIFSQLFYLTWYKESDFVWLWPYLSAVVFSLLFLWLCRFEMRTITKSEQRFLGYKGYILFYTKLLFLFIFTAVSLIISEKYKDAYSVPEDLIATYLIIMIACSVVYFIIYVTFLLINRHMLPCLSLIVCILPDVGLLLLFLMFKIDKVYDILTIDYHKKVKDWKTAGSIN